MFSAAAHVPARRRPVRARGIRGLSNWMSALPHSAVPVLRGRQRRRQAWFGSSTEPRPPETLGSWHLDPLPHSLICKIKGHFQHPITVVGMSFCACTVATPIPSQPSLPSTPHRPPLAKIWETTDSVCLGEPLSMVFYQTPLNDVGNIHAMLLSGKKLLTKLHVH